MKTLIVRPCRIGLVAGLAFFLGCARPSAEPPKAANVPAPSPAALTQNVEAPPVPAAPAATPPTAPAPVEVPTITERIPPVHAPANLALSPGLAEVVKLAQAGLGEEVIQAYVDKFSGSFQLGADQLLYLKDLGVSENVMTTILKHDSGAAAAAAPVAPLMQTQIVSNVSPPRPVNPAPPVETAAAAPVPPAGTAPPPTAPEVAQFYDALSPYGSWVYLSTYGWCWQPTVAVSVPTWRPYCDSGRWYWSDNGWYWNSDYSWGWAAFHYGRWYHNAGCGWVWTPGLAWGPSWVSWRSHGGYYGWAPLPPEARYVGGVGFSYYGSHVGIGFEFGLSAFHYSFVSAGNFCNYNPYRYCVSRGQVNNVYHNTTVVNNYVVGNNNTIVNHGVGRETVARNSQTKIREVSVRESPGPNVGGIRGERIEKQGDQSVVYRPHLPKTAPQTIPASYANRGGAQSIAPGNLNRTPAPGVAGSVAGSRPTMMGRTATGGGKVNTRPAANPNPGVSGQPSQNTKPQNIVGVNSTGSEQKAAPRVQSQPRPTAQPQPNQPRAGNSLFGTPAGIASTAPNRSTVNSSPGQRVYPQPQTVVPQTPTRTQPNNNSGSMSPRQYESVPRATVPNYNAQVRSVPQPTAPRPAAPQPTVPRQTAPPQTAPQRSAPAGGNVPSAPRTVPSGGGNRSGGGNSGSQNPRGQ